MSSFPSMMDAAQRWAKAFRPRHLTASPKRHAVVLTCMDARLDVFGLLGLDIGDAHILRNAGGRVTADVLRSLALSSAVLGTREVVIIHHTGCGLEGTTNDAIRATVREVSGAAVDDVDFLPFADVVASVREDLGNLRSSPHFPVNMTVWGAYYDVETGVLHPVT